MPRDQELQCDILKLYHDHETTGHPGKLKTYNSNTGGLDYENLSRTM